MYPATDYPDVQQIRLSVCDATDFREAAEVVKASALQLPGVDAVGIYAFDYRRDFHLVSYAGVSADAVPHFKFFAADSLQAQLVMRGDPIYRRVSELPAERAIYYERESLLAFAIYPIKHKQHVVGSLHVGTRTLPFIPAELFKQIEIFVASLGNSIARITFEAMMHRAYEEIEQKIEHRTKELLAANQMLRESEAKFRSVAENSRVMIAISQDEHLVYVNPYICQVSGYTKEELLSMDIRQFIHPDQREVAMARIAQRLHGEQMERSYEYLLISKRGRQIWAEVTPVQMEYQGAPALAIVAVDVTERKLSNEALQRSEARFRHLADSMPQLVWTADATGRIDYYNKRVEEFGGSTRRLDGTWECFLDIHPDERHGTLVAWQHALSTGENYQFEHRIRLRNGEYRWHLSRANAYRDECGKTVKWYGTTTDIHDEREAQQALKDAHRRKDDFLAMLGHELRNPLAPIRNAVHIFDRLELIDADLLRAREMLSRQVSHMARLLDDLLDVSRISRGKIQLKREILDLVQLLETVSNDQQVLYRNAAVELEVNLPRQPVWVNGDTARIQQIVDNLLNNALKFTDRGGRVALSLAVSNSHLAHISVKDTGIGIEAAMINQIFETFSQAERSLDRSRGGLGLGLALVRGLTEMHGGRVAVESAGLGHGTTFSVWLPVITPSMPPQVARQETAPNSSHRVLIIEDNIDAADSLQMLLSHSGHDVRVALNGREGLQLAREFLPDVVLCDIGLPNGMDGYAVARALRADQSLKGVYLIAMTGYGQESDRALALEAGFNLHITKPADPKTLKRLLERSP